MSIYLIFGIIAIASYIVQARLNSKFEKYSKEAIPNGLRGCDVAQRMLAQNGLYDVRVTQVNGRLTDHYNPTDKTVNLSPEVYNGNSVAAAAVAAHECGHAVQHATAYSFLTLRSKLVPVVSFASNVMPWLLLAGILLYSVSSAFLLIAIILFASTTLFSFVTLPVEIDASRRALAWLNSARVTDYATHEHAKDALKSAAYTYVVAALSSLATLIYYILIYTSRRD